MEKQLQPKLRFIGFEGEWKKSPLSKVMSYLKGFAFKSINYSRQGIRIIRVSDLGSSTVKNSFNNNIYLEREFANSFSKYKILKSDIIITTVGSKPQMIESAVGRPIYIINNDLGLLNQNLLILRTIKSGVDPYFIYCQLLSPKYLNHIDNIQRGNANQSNITVKDLQEFEISCASSSEQQKIADYLSNIDRKISLLEEKKVELSRYKRSMMQKLFSQEIRFKDDDRTDFGEWEIVRLGDISERVRTKNKENSQNILTISGQKGLINQFDYFLNQYAAKDVTGYYFIQKDDFAYNKSYSKGYPYGAIKRLVKYESGVLSTLYICFRFKINHSFSFFEHFFESGTFNHNLYKICVEGARNHGLLNVGIDDFFNEKISIPSLPEQQKIADFLSAIDDSINKVEEQIHQTKLFKKAMLQQMFV